MKLRRLVRPLWSPRQGFRDLHAAAPGLGASSAWMLAAALPWWILSTWFGTRQVLQDYEDFRLVRGSAWATVLTHVPGLQAGDLRQAFAVWPAAPPWDQVAPWVPLLALVGLLGIWLHDGVWDHAGLWLLRGLKAKDSGRVRATLAAEAQAQAVSWVGTALGLLTFLPGMGGVWSLLLAPLTVWLWLLRGWALAAHHGCPAWKGVVATLLHLVLFGLFLLVLLLIPILLMPLLLSGA